MARDLIIGREKEQQVLESCMQSSQAEFIAVYGRRRVGKTFLVRQYFDDKFDFYMTGMYQGSVKEQLANFTRQLNAYSNGCYPVVGDWMSAFDQLRHFLTTRSSQERIVIFIDELPWLDSPRSRFVRALELFWNEWASGMSNLKFIVCGSATTWMTNKLLGDKGGLHNRVTRRLMLRTFTLAETEAFMLRKGFAFDRLQTLNAYMALGGTPYYLNMLNPKYSVAQNIDELFFSDNAPLRGEYGFLFRSLFNDAPAYRRVVELLARKVKGMTRSEIVEALKLPYNGRLKEMFDNLCSCDFIRRYSAFGKKERDVMFQLVDHYSLFYIRFVKDDRSEDSRRWTHMLDSGEQHAWSGYAFEQVCLRHIDQLRIALGIDGIASDVCSWQTDGAQIDLVIDRKDHTINLCEMKYSEKPFALTKAYMNKMESRRELFAQATKTRKALHLTIASPFGVDKPQSVQSVITINDLFQATWPD